MNDCKSVWGSEASASSGPNHRPQIQSCWPETAFLPTSMAFCGLKKLELAPFTCHALIKIASEDIQHLHHVLHRHSSAGCWLNTFSGTLKEVKVNEKLLKIIRLFFCCNLLKVAPQFGGLGFRQEFWDVIYESWSIFSHEGNHTGHNITV